MYNRKQSNTIAKKVKIVNMPTTNEKIEQAVTNFVRGGDNRDTILLEKVLHKDFKFTNTAHLKTSGVTIFDKQKYLANIESGTFETLPKKITIERIEENDTIAMVKLLLESSENYSVSYNSLVLDSDNEWKLTNNLAFVIEKNHKTT